jgi:hypothetical protein
MICKSGISGTVTRNVGRATNYSFNVRSLITRIHPCHHLSMSRDGDGTHELGPTCWPISRKSAWQCLHPFIQLNVKDDLIHNCCNVPPGSCRYYISYWPMDLPRIHKSTATDRQIIHLAFLYIILMGLYVISPPFYQCQITQESSTGTEDCVCAFKARLVA